MTRPSRATRILGHLVTHNELDRYLPAAIDWLEAIVDGPIVAYDDQSSDGTYEYLKNRGVLAFRRPNSTPSFAEDESAFRGAAWRYLEGCVSPRRSDWILCVDADEFLVVSDPAASVREALTDTVQRALDQHIEAVAMPVLEVFDYSTGIAQYRVDGFWGEIEACRLVRWRPEGVFAPRIEGGGSVPTAWIDWRYRDDDLALMHLGYATEADRRARYERYRAGQGHNLRHIESILQTPVLKPWHGTGQSGFFWSRA